MYRLGHVLFGLEHVREDLVSVTGLLDHGFDAALDPRIRVSVNVFLVTQISDLLINFFLLLVRLVDLLLFDELVGINLDKITLTLLDSFGGSSMRRYVTGPVLLGRQM